MIVTYRDPRMLPLDVRWCWARRRWVVNGPEGDYGLSHTRLRAIQTAIDAVATGGPHDADGHGIRRIHVYDADNLLSCVITRVKQEGSSQFFQDEVE